MIYDGGKVIVIDIRKVVGDMREVVVIYVFISSFNCVSNLTFFITPLLNNKYC